MINRKLLFPLLVLILLISGAINTKAGPQAVITIDPTIKYQTITGWEATAQIGQTDYPNQFQSWKNQVINDAVNDLGVNRLRLAVRSGAENPVDYFTEYLDGKIDRKTWTDHWYQTINDNDNPNVINPNGFHFSELDFAIDNVALPMKNLLEARGEHLYINVNFTDFTGTYINYTLHNHPQEYAEFVLATYQHMQSKYGFVPDAWEMILEPDHSTSWTATDIGNAVVATVTRLKAAGFTPKFILPSTMSMANALPYFNQAIGIIQKSGDLSYVSELSYHRYSGVSDTNLQAIADRAAQLGINPSMLEHIGSGYQDLYQDLTLGMNTAWQQYTLAYPSTTDAKGSYFRIDLSNPNQPKVLMNSRTKFLRQYFKFIRSGAVRIQATSVSGNFTSTAFINPDGKYVVVVNASQGGTVSISGLKPETYGIKYTTGNQYDVDLPDVNIGAGQSLSASIPASGVITIYGKSFSPAPTPTPLPPGWESAYMPMVIKRSTNSATFLKQGNPTPTGSGCTTKSSQP